MRIGVNLLYFRPGAVGGSETYLRNVLGHLANGDHEVILYCWEGALSSLHGLGAARALFRGTPWRPRRLIHEIGSIPAACRSDCIDVLWSPGNFALPRRLDGIPQVATIHDLQHAHLPEYFGLATRLYRTHAFRWTLRVSERVIAISEFTRQGLISLYSADPSRVVTIHLGAERRPAPTASERAEARRLYGLPKQYVYYPASLWPHKNHELLLQALAAARRRSGVDLSLVLTGADQGRAEWLRALTRRLGLELVVRYLGFVPTRDVRAILAEAALLAFPSRFEGFGLPPLEAMALSVPVVAANRASIPEVVADAAVLIAPDDVGAWADALCRLATDHYARSNLVARGHENVGRFAWERCASATAQVLDSAAVSRGTTPQTTRRHRG